MRLHLRNAALVANVQTAYISCWAVTLSMLNPTSCECIFRAILMKQPKCSLCPQQASVERNRVFSRIHL